MSVRYLTVLRYLRSSGFGKLSRTEKRWFKSNLRRAAVGTDRQYTREGKARVRLYPETLFAAAIEPIKAARKAVPPVAVLVLGCLLSGCAMDQTAGVTPELEALINYSVVCALSAMVFGLVGYLIGVSCMRWKAAAIIEQALLVRGFNRGTVANILREGGLL